MEEDIDSFLYGGTDNGNFDLQIHRLATPVNLSSAKKSSPAVPAKEHVERGDDQGSESEEEDVEIVLESTEPAATSQPDLSGVGFLKMSAKPAAESQAVPGSASNVFDISSVAMLDGESLLDIDIEGFDEKPWRKPGADITDYFNFGFNEASWKQYCYKQKQLREEFSSSQYGPPQAKHVPTSRMQSAQQGQHSPRIHTAQSDSSSQPTTHSQQQRYSHEDSARREEPRGTQRRPVQPSDRDRDRQVYRHHSRSRSRSRGRYRDDRKRSHDAVDGSREGDSASRRRRMN